MVQPHCLPKETCWPRDSKPRVCSDGGRRTVRHKSAAPLLFLRGAATPICRHSPGQSASLLVLWSAIGLTFVVLNHARWPRGAFGIDRRGGAFRARASSVTALLFNQRVFRPATKSTARWTSVSPGAPGVLARQVLMWTLNSAVPSSLIVLLILCRWNGWVIETTASVEASDHGAVIDYDAPRFARNSPCISFDRRSSSRSD